MGNQLHRTRSYGTLLFLSPSHRSRKDGPSQPQPRITMNLKSPLVIVGLFGLTLSTARMAESSTKPAPVTPTPAAKEISPSAASSSAPLPPATRNERSTATQATPAKQLPPATAEAKAIDAANKEHLRPSRDRHKMETPPPALRSETKPPMPAQGMVWVPGHWIPVKGEWQWTAGHWGIPATPISVWIDAKYDPKTKQWSPGYWQPDRVTPEQPEVPASKEGQPPGEKFF